MFVRRLFTGSLALALVAAHGAGAFADAPVGAGTAVAAENLAAEIADLPRYANHELEINENGAFPGELKVFNESGQLVPARVKLFFVRNGQIVTQTLPNEDGTFQMVGLQPGIYTIVAAGQEGFGASSVRILPPAAKPAPKTNTISAPIREIALSRKFVSVMSISLVQPADVQTVSNIMQQEGLGGGGTGGAGTAGGGGGGGGGGGAGGGIGGGGGGGGGLAGLLGAAGAVAGGIAASDSSDDDSPQTTPPPDDDTDPPPSSPSMP